jgi:aryl-alcohol dehydrogenase-like predicted oxidoreductase
VAIHTGKPDTLQVVYNILHQDPEDELFALAQQENIGIIARVPLERGVLSGRFTGPSSFSRGDFRARMFSEQALAPLNAAVAKLGFLVKGDVPNLANAALRFVLSHRAVSSVIPGIRTVSQVDNNAAASGKRLPDDDLKRLRDLYHEEFRAIPFH